MKVDAVGIKTTDLKKTVQFYSHLGFQFPEYEETEDHLEALNINGGPRLMIDFGEPGPAKHSVFAVLYDSPAEVDRVVEAVKLGSGKVDKEPWNAFWGQRYAIVQDPDGYNIDLFAYLSK